jgi:hypothetical protein
MFVTNNSSAYVFFNEVCFNEDPFVHIVEETQGDRRRLLSREDANANSTPYSARSEQ